MPIFRYKIKDNQGKTIFGSLEANDKDEAADILNDQGYIIIKIIKRERVKIIDNISNKFINVINKRDIVFFMQQLSILISSGITIVQALKILEKQIKNSYFKKVVLDIALDIDNGNKISKSFGKYNKIFNNFFIQMIESGEESGKLDETLLFLAEQEEKKYILKQRIRNAMIYPIFVFITLLVVIVIMLSFVVPNIINIFLEAGIEPSNTLKNLMVVNNIIFSFWWLLIILVGCLYYVIKQYKQTYSGQRFFHSLVLKLPIIGNVFKKFYLIQFSRSFYTLISGGVSINQSLKLSKEAVDNLLYKELIDDVIEKVEDGGAMSSVLMTSKLIPSMYAHMVRTGEESGKISIVIEKVIIFYTKEIDDSIKNAITLFEPTAMIIIGIIVGFLISTIIIPIYNISIVF